MSAYRSPHWLPPTGLMLITCRPTDTLQRNNDAHRLLHFSSHIMEVTNKHTWLVNWPYNLDRGIMTEVWFHKLMQAKWKRFARAQRQALSSVISSLLLLKNRWADFKFTVVEVAFSSSSQRMKPLLLTFGNRFWLSCSPLQFSTTRFRQCCRLTNICTRICSEMLHWTLIGG